MELAEGASIMRPVSSGSIDDLFLAFGFSRPRDRGRLRGGDSRRICFQMAG